jgi:tetratricopeptide (TPR) repeat protein
LRILSRVDPDRGLLLVAPFYWVTHTSALHRLGDRAAEVVSARRGVRRFPDRYWPHVNLLLALAADGNVKAVRRELSRTTRDNPTAGTRQASLWVWRELRAHGHEAAAARWLAGMADPALTDSSDTTLAGSVVEGDVQYAAGRWDLARQHYARALARYPKSPVPQGRLGATAARLGDGAAAQRLEESLSRATDPYLFGSHTYARARIAAALGDHGAAVELLRAAWAQGRPLAFDDRDNEDVHADPDFEVLRGFPPFLALMRTD